MHKQALILNMVLALEVDHHDRRTQGLLQSLAREVVKELEKYTKAHSFQLDLGRDVRKWTDIDCTARVVGVRVIEPCGTVAVRTKRR